MSGSSINHTTTVHNMNDDVLHTIFMFASTDPWYQPDIYTARMTSQVCRSWRRILLHSPLIWGRLVIFRDAETERTSPQWLFEVIRRSGSSPLWVTASVDITRDENSLHEYRSKAVPLFLRCLKDNWKRVENLNILVTTSGTSSSIDTEDWGVFYSPAPALRSFIVEINLPDFPSMPEKLLGGYAPHLEHFESNFFYIRRPVLSLGAFIHTFIFKNTGVGHVTATVTVEELSDILCFTPKLESLVVSSDIKVDVDYVQGGLKKLPSASLPSLKNIEIEDDLHTCILLLNSIIDIPPSCTVNVVASINLRSPSLSTTMSLLPNFGQRLFNRSSERDGHMILREESIRIETHSSINVVLTLCIYWTKCLTFPVQYIPILEEVVSSSNLRSTTKLRLTMHVSDPPELLAMFASFTSVTHVETDIHALRSYNISSREMVVSGSIIPLPFPSLRKLTVTGFGHNWMVRDLARFLSYREELRTPIHEVVLLGNQFAGTLYNQDVVSTTDLRPLKDFRELHVFWEDRL